MNDEPARPPAAVTRRAALAGLGAGALGLALATQRLRAAAQDATPAATPVSREGHLIIGAWQHHNPPTNPSTNLTVLTFHPDGTYLAYHDNLGVGIGVWRATGERTADVVVSFQRLAGAQNLTTLEAVFAPDHVPTGHAFDGEMVTFRITIAVEATGDTMTLAGSAEGRDPDGTVAFTDPYQGVATRLAPVAPVTAATPTA